MVDVVGAAGAGAGLSRRSGSDRVRLVENVPVSKTDGLDGLAIGSGARGVRSGSATNRGQRNLTETGETHRPSPCEKVEVP